MSADRKRKGAGARGASRKSAPKKKIPSSHTERGGIKEESIAKSRSLYSEEQKKLVRERYQFCITREEKEELARQLGMDSLEQLYNLANRLKATRPQQDKDFRHGNEQRHGAFDPQRLRLREDPKQTVFTPEDDQYIRLHFGKRHIEQIAFHRNHTESAIMWRARHLGVRRFCKYYDAEKVSAWIDMDMEEMEAYGLDLYHCHDRKGKYAITLVSSSSLIRLVDSKLIKERILGERDVDLFFIKEVEETLAAVEERKVTWESSRWVSHGHTCLNAFAGVSFGLFDDGSDRKMMGRELTPKDISRSQY